MRKKNVLTGVVTLSLLCLIIFVIKNIQTNTEAISAQNQPEQQRNTASLQHFSLSEMVDRSGRIFRGTVIDFEPGTKYIAGADFPTVTYRLRVEQSFKGDFPEKGGVKYAEITMLGNIKKAGAQGHLKKMQVLPTPQMLNVGADYLLLLTAESSAGLSTPVGLGQGSFEIFTQDKQEWAKNEYNNAGIFDGPVKYDELAAKIQRGGK